MSPTELMAFSLAAPQRAGASPAPTRAVAVAVGAGLAPAQGATTLLGGWPRSEAGRHGL